MGDGGRERLQLLEFESTHRNGALTITNAIHRAFSRRTGFEPTPIQLDEAADASGFYLTDDLGRRYLIKVASA